MDRYLAYDADEWVIHKDDIRVNYEQKVPRTNGFKGIYKGYIVLVCPIPPGFELVIEKLRLFGRLDISQIQKNLLNVRGIYIEDEDHKYLVTDMPPKWTIRDLLHHETIHITFRKKIKVDV